MFSAADRDQQGRHDTEKPLAADLIEVVYFHSDAAKLSLVALPETPTWIGLDGNLHSIFRGADVVAEGFLSPKGAPVCEVRHRTYSGLLEELLAHRFKIQRDPALIARLSGVELFNRLREICVMVALIAKWPKKEDGQYSVGFALAGMIAKAGLSREDAVRIVGLVAELSGDWSVGERIDSLDRTYSRHANRLPVVSKRKLESIVGRRAVTYAINMLTRAPAPQAPVRTLTWEDLYGPR